MRLRRLALMCGLLLLFGCSPAQTYVELILDASGSMFNRLDDGRYRIVAAKEALSDFVASLPGESDLNVGLRVYGSQMLAIEEGACEDSELFVPMEGLDRQALLGTVRDTQAQGATPIALSLRRAAQDFPQTGRKVIVLVTDGEESCGGDVRAAAQELREQGVEIDLRIIGFDLSEEAVQSFEGLGTFENARSAADLSQALERAVEVAPQQETFPVEVHLTRDGRPTTEGAGVRFVDVVSGDAFDLSPRGEGVLTADLPPGRYRAVVTDALGDGPREFAGLAVTAEGENVFEFELAREPQVSLTVEPAQPTAGSEVTIDFEGAPTGGDYQVVLAPHGAPDDVSLQQHGVEGGSGSVAALLPIEPATFEARFLAYLGNGGATVLGRSEPFTSVGVEASLTAPDEVPAGSQVGVEWQGPDNPGDYLTIVPVGAPEGDYGNWVHTSAGNPASFRVPDEAGSYELRYMSGQGVTLATRPLTVTEVSASISAPEAVDAGSRVEISWTGPNNDGDYITIVPEGSAEGTYDNYAYTSSGNPLQVTAPARPGLYEVRYVTGQASVTLASAPLQVEAVEATVSGPGEATIGSRLEVNWTGPNNDGDYITVVPAGAPEGSYENYAYTSAGSPAVFSAPEQTGQFEIRYVEGQENSTLARAPLTLLPASATLEAPAQVDAGARVTIEWTGPDNRGDFITIVPAGAAEGDWGNYAYTSAGSPARVTAPDEPGQYEIRYLLGQSYATLEAIPLTVR